MRHLRHALPGLFVILASAPLGCSFLLTGDYSGQAEGDTADGGADALVGDASGGSNARSDAAPDEATGYAATVIGDGPVSYWRLDETGGATAKDAMGRHDLVVVGPSVTFSQPGALAHDTGTSVVLAGSSKLEAGSVFDLADRAPFTIEAWVRPTANDSDYRFIFSKMRTSPREGSYLFANFGESRVAFERWAAGKALDGATWADQMRSDRFTHVVVTMGERLTLYIDAAVMSVGESPAPAAPDPDVSTSWGSNFMGALDELAFYDKELSAAQVKAHFDAAH